MAASSVPLQVAETLQTAHLKRDPSPQHDLNPSTAADRKEPVHLEPVFPDDGGIDGDESDVEEDDDELYRSRIKPHTRGAHHHQLPAMPDLRFEQSYLHSIRDADTWWRVGWITVRDQMMMPFVQGILYNLAICGWQYWNRNARLSGSSIGARVRRWWWGVNKWPIPPESKGGLVRRVQ
ncbi:hypothetical protein MMYC01_202456 [Madurella mycetomatis]|uniref:DUF1770 domain-containing protein n=1 Tax=Madurella mycetomatis TaxID=100816 RepID=A0A175WA63_9PEZI|nr:hypothetical protein MMYC01_202456 [Madurella mycetomatis]